VGVEMRRMVDEPEHRAAIDETLEDVYRTLFMTASPTCTKAALNLLGLEAGHCRLPMVDADARERLTAALLDADRAGELAATLDELLLARFVRVAAADLDVFLHRAHAAEAAGYAKLA